MFILYEENLQDGSVWDRVYFVKCGSLFSKTSKVVDLFNICEYLSGLRSHLEILILADNSVNKAEYVLRSCKCMKYVLTSEFPAVFRFGIFPFFYVVCCAKECRPPFTHFNV